jgi:sodium-dependent phosphate cotransporter
MTTPGDSPSKTPGPPRIVAGLRHVGLFALAFLLFALALVMIRQGAGALAEPMRTTLHLATPSSALGFGWLLAMLALSGSPVAATSLSFLDAGVMTAREAFAMIGGSRLGAAFIVLVIGFVHLLRGRQRTLSLGAGLLSLLVTQTTYLFVVPLGFFMLSRGWLTVHWHTVSAFGSPFELLVNPLVSLLERLMPAWALFPLGFLLLLPTFRLFDAALPNLHLEESRVAGLNRVLYRPVISFLLGALLTTLTMSVSVSLGLLVPLSARGYIRQENIIPYIMGANITTFDDTLLAAMLLGNSTAVTVVLVQMVSVAVVSLLFLSLVFRPYQRLLGRLAAFVGRTPTSLAIYVIAMFVLPIVLILGGP